MSWFNLGILPIILAGMANASYVIPTRYIQNISYAKLWFYYSIVSFMIVPWILFIVLLPHALQNYLHLSFNVWALLIIGGLILGLGQFCFAYAFRFVGIALAFTISLGVASTIGSLFVVFYKHEFFSLQGFLVMLAVGLIITGLIIYYFAGRNHSTLEDVNQPLSKNYQLGWLLAFFSGSASGIQSIIFYLLAFNYVTPFQHSNSYWVWPPFLFATAIVMLIGFFYNYRKYESNMVQARFFTLKNISLICIMGFLCTGSLALYSWGMNILTPTQQIIGWPAFMVSIVLASQVWSSIYKEAKHFSVRAKIYKNSSLILLIAAIIILAFAG